jgi:hypothetical protein
VWHPSPAAVASSPPAGTGPITPQDVGVHVHATVFHVASTVTDLVPAAAPVVQVATGTVGRLPADL